MRLAGDHPLHLSYCTNIHAGETWPEVQHNLRTRVLEVRERVAAGRQFGIGLRLSDTAARELEGPEELAKFRDFLAEHELYVFTINGFPFGRFHGVRVKELVYLPDWLEPERVEYSDRLARILAAILPEGIEGSISTVPGAFKPRAPGDNEARAIAENIRRHARELGRIAERTGKKIALALEPEPACLLETTAETIEFFEQHLFRGSDEKLLREHAGVCFDACHMSVGFEEPEAAVERLARAGIRIVKAQISAGLALTLGADAEEKLRALVPYADEVYLHQVVERRGGTLRRFVDLPEAIAHARAEGGHTESEWRIHFHVPIFLERLGIFDNTQTELARLLEVIRRTRCTEHLEVETYCWDVLPAEYRREEVTIAVARELEWARRRLEV